MDLQGLAQSTVDRIADSIAQHGTDIAGRLTDTTLNGLYRLIAQRLQNTATGTQLLDSLVRAPADDERRARVAEMIREAAARDAEFASSLRQAASQAGAFSVGPESSYWQSIESHSGGDQFRNIGGNVTNKRFQIGNVHFGFGWLAIGIVATALLITGGVTVIGARKDAVNLTSLAGEWGGPGRRPTQGFTTGPTSLTVSADGKFSFAMESRMDFPSGNQPPPGTVPDGFGQFNFDCSGTVTADGDYFTFRDTTGLCGTFQAAFGPNSNVLDVFNSNGSEGGSMVLVRIK
jgi:hypothetical protein